MFYCVSCRLAAAISVIAVVVSDNDALNTDAVSVYLINKCSFFFLNLDPETVLVSPAALIT